MARSYIERWNEAKVIFLGFTAAFGEKGFWLLQYAVGEKNFFSTAGLGGQRRMRTRRAGKGQENFFFFLENFFF